MHGGHYLLAVFPHQADSRLATHSCSSSITILPQIRSNFILMHQAATSSLWCSSCNMLSQLSTPPRHCGYKQLKALHHNTQWSFWWWIARYYHLWQVCFTLIWVTADHFHHLASRACLGARFTLYLTVSLRDSLREPWGAIIFCRMLPRVWSLRHFSARIPTPIWLSWSRPESAWFYLQLSFQASPREQLKHDCSQWHPCSPCF